VHTAAYDKITAALNDSSNTLFAQTILSMRKGEAGVSQVTLDSGVLFR
jgi:hypothetical protein